MELKLNQTTYIFLSKKSGTFLNLSGTFLNQIYFPSTTIEPHKYNYEPIFFTDKLTLNL